MIYRLHGKPWRTYAVVPRWRLGEHGGSAGELVLVGFYQQQGANVRGSAILGFIVYLIVAAGLMTLLLLYRLRAHQRMRASSWTGVALLSAVGGAIAGVLFMLRPPDVGGYEEPPDILSIVVFVMLISCASGVTGIFFAWARLQLYRRSLARLLVISLVLLFVIALTTILTAKWSAYARPATLETWAHLRNAYHIYFASSVALPLVLCQDAGPHSGETIRVHDRFLRLLGIAAFCGFLAFLLGVATSEILQVTNPGQIYRGFYKPSGGVVLWILSLFIIASVSAALAAGNRSLPSQHPNGNRSRAVSEAELQTAPQPASSRWTMRNHTILFLAANPSGTDRLALDRQARAIRMELERSGYRDGFEFVTRWAAEPLDLIRELRKLKPTVVHFSGHVERMTGEHARDPVSGRDISDQQDLQAGETQQGRCFQNAEGHAHLVSAVALGETFGAAGSSVRLIVLNACYSEQQAAALLTHVDCVVGIRDSLRHEAARSFAIGFYGALGDGESVEAAFAQGCAAITLEGLTDADRPQLKVRSGTDAVRLVLAADDPPKPRGTS